jgi:hypothetical protein
MFYDDVKLGISLKSEKCKLRKLERVLRRIVGSKKAITAG